MREPLVLHEDLRSHWGEFVLVCFNLRPNLASNACRLHACLPERNQVDTEAIQLLEPAFGFDGDAA